MHKRFLFAGTAAAALLAGCQATKSTTATPASATVETLGTTAVPASEFAYVYRKNNSSAPDYGTKAGVQEYLDLYTNFKLKVLAAEQRGLDTTQAFQRELEGYKQQLAQPYLTEKSVTDQLVREAYDRMSKEVSASHILVRLAARCRSQGHAGRLRKGNGPAPARCRRRGLRPGGPRSLAKTLRPAKTAASWATSRPCRWCTRSSRRLTPRPPGRCRSRCARASATT